MNNVWDYVVEKTHELMKAHSCSKEAKAASQNWLDAVGTENQIQATKKYIAELKADIMPIDDLIAFVDSERGQSIFGQELAKNILAHAQDIKLQGAKYCDCPACKAALDILNKEYELLAKKSD